MGYMCGKEERKRRKGEREKEVEEEARGNGSGRHEEIGGVRRNEEVKDKMNVKDGTTH